MYIKQYVFREEIRNEGHITEYHMTLSRGCGSETCSDYFVNVFTILKLQSMVFESKAARKILLLMLFLNHLFKSWAFLASPVYDTVYD